MRLAITIIIYIIHSVAWILTWTNEVGIHGFNEMAQKLYLVNTHYQ